MPRLGLGRARDVRRIARRVERADRGARRARVDEVQLALRARDELPALGAGDLLIGPRATYDELAAAAQIAARNGFERGHRRQVGAPRTQNPVLNTPR